MRATVPVNGMGRAGAGYPRAWVTAGLLLVALLVQGCPTSNKGSGGVPQHGAASITSTGGTLTLIPEEVTITQISNNGGCTTLLQFTVIGGTPPFRFVTSFVFPIGSIGNTTIDSNGVYRANLQAGTTVDPDTVTVIDAIGSTDSTEVTIMCT